MKKLKLREIATDDEASWSYGPNLVIYMDIGTAGFDKDKRSLPRYYWRMSDPGGKDLFTVEIDQISGIVVMMELTAYSDRLYPLNKTSNPVEVVQGVPKFDSAINLQLDVQGWPAVYDVPAKFKIQIDMEQLRIELFPDSISRYVLAGQKYLFEFNEMDELCAVSLNGFDIKCQDNLLKEYRRRGDEGDEGDEGDVVKAPVKAGNELVVKIHC